MCEDDSKQESILLGQLDRTNPATRAEQPSQEILTEMTKLLLASNTFIEWNAFISSIISRNRGIIPQSLLNEIAQPGSALQNHLNDLKIKEFGNTFSRKKY